MMDNKTTKTRESARLFVGIEVPDEVRGRIRSILEEYTRYTKRTVPEENWHLTVLFIGEVEGYERYLEDLSQKMAQAFLPTISLTHVGRGARQQQLWAFAKPTLVLAKLKEQLMARVNTMQLDVGFSNRSQDFVPHIKLADLRGASADSLLADTRLTAVWPVEELNIYRSELSSRGASYSVVERINLLT